MKPTRIALIGDFNPEVVAHRAINRSTELFRATSQALEAEWIGTETVIPGDELMLRSFNGIWCVPASPYQSTSGALWAIHFARTHRVPFLGTCGGFQHALIEVARNVHGLTDADHEELQPDAGTLLIRRLSCSLVEKSQRVAPTGKGKFGCIYGMEARDEGYCCSFGLNPAYGHLFQNGPLEITAQAEDGSARAMELKGHPFFMGTLFQPERRALQGELHPLVQAFFRAAQARNLTV